MSFALVVQARNLVQDNACEDSLLQYLISSHLNSLKEQEVSLSLCNLPQRQSLTRFWGKNAAGYLLHLKQLRTRIDKISAYWAAFAARDSHNLLIARSPSSKALEPHGRAFI